MIKKLLLALLVSLFTCTLAFAQDVTVSGKVTDVSGAGLPGATVTVRGTKIAVITDENGNFTITARRGATLVVTDVGYSGREISASGTSLKVALSQESKALEDIVVTALGIKKERKALSYSATEVNGGDLTGPRTVDVANSLEGKVAGLNISPSATGPQGSTRIIIRGNGSLSGDNQPLIVVDGVPMDNTNLNNAINGVSNGSSSVGMWGGVDLGDGISSLNPDDIESVTVLKGGTAAALYGARASNGAILVTTKSGNKSQGIGLEYNSNFQLDRLEYEHFKDYQYQYGIGDAINGALQGSKPAGWQATFQTNSYGAPLDGSSVLQFDSVARPYVAQKNNLKNFYNTGTTWTNSVAMSGGGDKITYRFSLSDLNNHGVLPNNTLRRDNYSVNLVGNLSKRFTFTANAKYTVDKSHNPPRVSDSPGNADYSMYTLPTSLSVKTLKTDEVTPTGDEYIWSNNQYVNNPYFAVNKYAHDLGRNRILTSFVPKFNLTDWLYVKAIVGFDKYNFTNTDITPTGTGYSLGGSYTRNLLDFTESNVGFIGGVTKRFGDKFGLDAFVGNNAMKRSILTNTTSGGPFNIPYYYDIANINPANASATDGDAETRINSLFGEADLSYNNYLYLHLTGRNDWFSTLTPPPSYTGPVNNHIFYPSVGLSFVLSDAMKMPEWVNFAKVRAAWAQVGGGVPTPYQLALSYSLTGAYNGAPLGAVGTSTIPNEHLVPLTDQSDEIGLETHLFNNRLYADLAVYQRKTSKDIVNATVTPASGYTAAVINVGKINNNGVELLLSYRWISQKSFTWESSINLGYNKSKVVALYGGLTQITADNARTQTGYIAQEIGKPYSELQVVAFARNAQGKILNDTATGLPVQAATLKDMGTGVSPWTTGLTNTFTYKRFSLNILIDGKFGGVIFEGTQGLAYRYGLAKETLPGRTTGIAGPGVENINNGQGNVPNTKILSAETYYVNLYNYGEPFVFSSDFIKLRSVSLDYNISSKLFHGTFFKSAVFSLVGRNLWTIMKHTPNIDPESTYNNGNAQGLEFASTPFTRSMGVNLNLKF